ncbi:MAG: hypothetical protein CIT03_02560 [Methanobacterium sp.]|nr:MAG: hypothetical protein CIT03_02560 [Methanobacterium sp.]
MKNVIFVISLRWVSAWYVDDATVRTIWGEMDTVWMTFLVQVYSKKSSPGNLLIYYFFMVKSIIKIKDGFPWKGALILYTPSAGNSGSFFL